jgi:hypothetical protein
MESARVENTDAERSDADQRAARSNSKPMCQSEAFREDWRGGLERSGRKAGRGRAAVSDDEEKANTIFSLNVSLPTCTVSCSDLKEVEHAIEVTADSLYRSGGSRITSVSRERLGGGYWQRANDDHVSGQATCG